MATSFDGGPALVGFRVPVITASSPRSVRSLNVRFLTDLDKIIFRSPAFLIRLGYYRNTLISLVRAHLHIGAKKLKKMFMQIYLDKNSVARGSIDNEQT